MNLRGLVLLLFFHITKLLSSLLYELIIKKGKQKTRTRKTHCVCMFFFLCVCVCVRVYVCFFVCE